MVFFHAENLIRRTHALKSPPRKRTEPAKCLIALYPLFYFIASFDNEADEASETRVLAGVNLHSLQPQRLISLPELADVSKAALSELSEAAEKCSNGCSVTYRRIDRQLFHISVIKPEIKVKRQFLTV